MGDLSGDLALTLTSEMLWTAVMLCAPIIGGTTAPGRCFAAFRIAQG